MFFNVFEVFFIQNKGKRTFLQKLFFMNLPLSTSAGMSLLKGLISSFTAFVIVARTRRRAVAVKNFILCFFDPDTLQINLIKNFMLNICTQNQNTKKNFQMCLKNPCSENHMCNFLSLIYESQVRHDQNTKM